MSGVREAQLRVLYVVSRWRQPTETFIRREIDAARRAGTSVTVLSLKRPIAHLPADPPVLWMPPTRVVRELGWMVLHRPRLTLALAFRCLRGSTPRTAVRQLAATMIGVAAARRAPPVDWIHAHFAWVSSTAAWALAAGSGVPYSIMTHAHDIFDDSLVDTLLAQKLQHARLVFAVSQRIAEQLQTRYGVPTYVQRMGVPLAYVRDGTDRCPEHGLIVSVGSLLPKKGHDVLIRALAELPDHRLVIIGAGPEESRLRDLASSVASGQVEFVGVLPEQQVRSWLDRATVFVLAARVTEGGDRDGVPVALMEAMARGVPVVSTEVSGIPELLDEDRGTIVEPERPDLLATAIRRTRRDPGRTERAKQHVAAYYTTEQNWERLRQAIVQARSSGSPAGMRAEDHCEASDG